jgi:hypothetical protein
MVRLKITMSCWRLEFATTQSSPSAAVVITVAADPHAAATGVAFAPSSKASETSTA